MDNNNYVLTALPSYVRYSRREIGKASKEDRRESAFSGIRQKLSSAVISVPYGGGLDNLRLIGNLEDHEFQNRFTSYKKPKRKKNRRRDVSETDTYMSEGDLSPVKSHHYKNYNQFSPTKLFFTGRKPARIGSETSTTSTATSKSRSTIYSTSENDDGYWAQKLKELDEVKERYSDNSDFLTSLYGYKLKDKHKNGKKKKKKSKVKRDDESTPQSMTDDVRNRVILPPIQQKPTDVGKSRESTLTNTSDESNTSTIVANEENENSKRRKVEFNLQKIKRSLKLPPLEGRHESHESHKVKNPKRSILKKMDKNTESVVNSFPPKVNTSVWQVGKLKSPIPIPSSASRRQQVTFKRSPFNLKYKCSKEFETVATNYDSDRKPSFLTE